MPRTSCEPLVNRPRTRRSAKRENPYHNKKNDAKKDDIKEVQDDNAPRTVDLSLCVLCNSKIHSEERRFLKDVQYHYTLCYFRQGQFREIVPPINNDENKRQYICSRQGCSMREMRYREYCVHEGIAHRKTQQLMACDQTPRMKDILSRLYPMKENTAVLTDTTKMAVNNQQMQLTNPRKNVRSSNKDVKKSAIQIAYSSRMEEEEIDDPSSIPLKDENGKVGNEPKKIETFDFDYKDDLDEDLITPDLNKPFNCFICDSREGRNLNLNHLDSVKYHLAYCLYHEKKLLNFIDAGPLNRNPDGFPIDEIGTQFKYRCPFPTCPKNTATRGGPQPMGYKAYSLHLGKEHNLLEVVLVGDKRSGAAEARAAIIQARRSEGGRLERMPEVQFEEVHVCLVCNGENREGKNLSFDPNKITSLRYHYASCFYDTGVYLQNYSELFQLDQHEDHEKNIGEDGKPKDILGTIYKYTCKEKKCSVKRNMGLKAYCIHTAHEHNIVIQIMLKSEREDLRKLGIRLKAFFG